MVIDPNNISTTANAKNKLTSSERVPASKAKEAPSQSAPHSNGDSVSLSSQAQSLGKLEAAVSDASSVDSEKVAAVKSALQSGRYSVNADTVAQNMLDQGTF